MVRKVLIVLIGDFVLTRQRTFVCTGNGCVEVLHGKGGSTAVQAAGGTWGEPILGHARGTDLVGRSLQGPTLQLLHSEKFRRATITLIYIAAEHRCAFS